MLDELHLLLTTTKKANREIEDEIKELLRLKHNVLKSVQELYKYKPLHK